MVDVPALFLQLPLCFVTVHWHSSKHCKHRKHVEQTKNDQNTMDGFEQRHGNKELEGGRLREESGPFPPFDCDKTLKIAPAVEKRAQGHERVAVASLESEKDLWQVQVRDCGAVNWLSGSEKSSISQSTLFYVFLLLWCKLWALWWDNFFSLFTFFFALFSNGNCREVLLCCLL